MSKNIIYYGSYTKVDNPKIIKGKYYKDFGDGFYCTIFKKQSIKWASKFNKSIVNIYEYNENSKLNIKVFNLLNEEWLDFIIDNRSGKEHNYDIVIGPMADDQIYNYVNDLLDGIITRDAFWELSKFKYPTHQIAFCSNEALSCLKYLECEVINDGK